jgi:hypothetical protein
MPNLEIEEFAKMLVQHVRDAAIVALRTVAWALVHNVGEELGLEASWSPK